jgi:hypothetical protein
MIAFAILWTSLLLGQVPFLGMGVGEVVRALVTLLRLPPSTFRCTPSLYPSKLLSAIILQKSQLRRLLVEQHLMKTPSWLSTVLWTSVPAATSITLWGWNCGRQVERWWFYFDLLFNDPLPSPPGLAFHFETSKTPSFAVRLLSNIRRHQFGPLSFVSAAIRVGMEVSEVVRVLVAQLQLLFNVLLHIPLLLASPSSFQTFMTPSFTGFH